MKRPSLPALFLVALVSGSLGAQRVDYDAIYRFPLSVGLECQDLSPFFDYGFARGACCDLSGSARVPLPFLPSLQPLLKAGMITLVRPESESRWGHVHWYTTPGLACIHRFSRTIEVGIEAAAGASEAVFPTLDPTQPRGWSSLLAEVGAQVGPSYSFSLDVHPRCSRLEKSMLST